MAKFIAVYNILGGGMSDRDSGMLAERGEQVFKKNFEAETFDQLLKEGSIQTCESHQFFNPETGMIESQQTPLDGGEIEEPTDGEGEEEEGAGE